MAGPTPDPNAAKTALVVVDVQADFCEGGSLAVPGGKRAAKEITAWALDNAQRYVARCATRDSHVDPGGHFSDEPDFKDSWPVHCVAGTAGAEPPAELGLDFDAIFFKGAHEAAYSGFQGRREGGECLLHWLDRHGVTALHVAGIAFDYCVAHTALDGAAAGFSVSVLTDLSPGVSAAGSEEAAAAMAAGGVRLTSRDEAWAGP